MKTTNNKLFRWQVLTLLLACVTSASAQAPLRLWYENPAKYWTEALPIGNGRIGAMVFGDAEHELMQLNECTLWSGKPNSPSVNPTAYDNLKPLREALDKGDYAAADKYARKMQGYNSQRYLPLADLHIYQRYGGKGKAYDYRRELSLDEATVSCTYGKDGVNYTRRSYTSAPDNAMIVEMTASKPASVSADIRLTTQLTQCSTDTNLVAPNGSDELILHGTLSDGGMRYQTIVKAKAEGGHVTADAFGIHVTNADKLVLYVTAATSFNGYNKNPQTQGKDESGISRRLMDGVVAKSLADVRDAHVKDFKKYFDRVTLDIVDTTYNKVNDRLPSDLRLKLYSYGNYDPQLETLFFQYGRYLLISSSREGGTPANLQGIWNNYIFPPWSSNYTININAEMNYWPAESGNMSEMHLPMLSWIKDLAKAGEATAKEYYHARGWVAHHNSDIWCLTNPVGQLGKEEPLWCNWQMGGNWVCMDLWEHYQYTGDKKFLREDAYPVMKSAALFCLDWMQEKDGYLITSPSSSPENYFVVSGKKYAVTKGATMDLAIIRELFNNLILASEVLGTDASFRNLLKEKVNKIHPYQIGKQGQLLEWLDEHQEDDPHHRHLSHLFGLHPGHSITPLHTPEYAAACNRTFQIRGDAGTGWSKGWKINFAARLLDGNHAYKMIREILDYVDPEKSNHGGTYPNFFDAHPPFQIDGNFGATAGVIEMLLQSHNSSGVAKDKTIGYELHLLPALPDAWSSGEVKGLKARGNYEVGIKWADHKLQEAVIKSNVGGECTIRTSCPVSIAGVNSTCRVDGKYFVLTFHAEKGAEYKVVGN